LILINPIICSISQQRRVDQMHQQLSLPLTWHPKFKVGDHVTSISKSFGFRGKVGTVKAVYDLGGWIYHVEYQIAGTTVKQPQLEENLRRADQVDLDRELLYSNASF